MITVPRQWQRALVTLEEMQREDLTLGKPELGVKQFCLPELFWEGLYVEDCTTSSPFTKNSYNSTTEIWVFPKIGVPPHHPF